MKGGKHVKKKYVSFLLALAMVCSLSAPVFALNTVTINGTDASMPAAGYCLTNDKASGVTITPQGATYNSFRGTVAGINDNNEVTLYPGSATLQVTVSGTDAGSQYTVMLLQGGKNELPTASTIKYVNQSAGGNLTFTINPMTPAQGNLTVWVTSNAEGFETKKVLIGYVNASTQVTNAKNYKLGDVTGEGTIDATDALAILKHYAIIETLTGTKLLAADVDKNGEVNATDALEVLKYFALLPSLLGD